MTETKELTQVSQYKSYPTYMLGNEKTWIIARELGMRQPEMRVLSYLAKFDTFRATDGRKGGSRIETCLQRVKQWTEKGYIERCTGPGRGKWFRWTQAGNLLRSRYRAAIASLIEELEAEEGKGFST
jgi:hypothetical protein